MALLWLGVCIAVVFWYYGAEWAERDALRQEQRLEDAHLWAQRSGHITPPELPLQPMGEGWLIPPGDSEEELIPSDRRLKSTTINHDTGEIIEKWTTE